MTKHSVVLAAGVLGLLAGLLACGNSGTVRLPPDGATEDAACIPSCEGKACGADDGCGGTCLAGSGCECTPSCEGKPCGSADGCGGTCVVGSGCECTPSCDGKPCGADDGCGGTCVVGSGCECTPDCDGKPCGSADGCGGTCVKGQSSCICQPDCQGKICGVDDGCGNLCRPGSGCCEPHCQDVPCGADDGCGNPCTAAQGCCDPSCLGRICGEENACHQVCQEGSGCCVRDCSRVTCGTAVCGVECTYPQDDCICVRQCENVACGQPDGCGGVCSWPQDPCTCDPDCAGKVCGADDGCGNICEYGSGCQVSCRHFTFGSATGTNVMSTGFDNTMAPFQVLGGSADIVASDGAVTPHGGAGMLRLVGDAASRKALVRYVPATRTEGRVSVWFYDTGTNDTSLWVSVIDGTELVPYVQDPANGQRYNVAVGFRPRGSGLNPPPNPNTYFLRTDVDYQGEQPYFDTGIQRSVGWHHVEVWVTPSGAFARLDGQSLLQLSHNPYLTRFGSVWLATTDGTSALYFDDVQVRTLPSVAAQEFGVVDRYVTMYAGRDMSALVPCSCSGGGNSRTPLMHMAMGYALRYHRSCRTSDLDRAIAYLQDVLDSYPCWQQRWTSAAFVAFTGMTAWLIWDALSQSQRQAVYAMFTAEDAHFVDDCTPDPSNLEGYVHCPYVSGTAANNWDSKAEENAWASFFYAMAANMFASAPDVAKWRSRALAAGRNTFTTGGAGETTRTVNGSAGAVDYFLVNNHGAHPNSFYTGASLQLLDSAMLPYALTGTPIPSDLYHNAAQVFEQYFTRAIDLYDYTFVYLPTTRWDLDGAWLFPFGQGANLGGDDVYALLERDVVDYKYRAGGLYENPGSGAVACNEDPARNNGRVQWYWVMSGLLWHLRPALRPVPVP